MWRNRTKYLKHVSAGLDRACREADTETLRLEGSKLIVFSDLHRGIGDRADDFRPCRKIYHAALGYYDSLDYRLFMLGDIEELWERLLSGVVDEYESTLALERRFFDRGRAVRFLGNHDESLTWPWNRTVIDRFTGKAPLKEALILKIVDESENLIGKVLFLHGHQGIRYSWLDRWVVKRFWAPIQRLTGLKSGTPSKDHMIRRDHERALYEWAQRQPDLLLVCGHTHHPVFMSAAWEQTIRGELDALHAEGASREEIAMKKAHLQWVTADLEEVKSALPDDARPCYFNTGCCSFNDGSITGIEIVDGRIRLVRWSGESGEPVRQSLREGDLEGIFRNCPGDHCPSVTP